ncbi:gallidermin/nisin family lantibiotic [Corynebacterium minutissimum]
MSQFNFDFAEGSKTDSADTQITSKSLCTPGCITGWLQGCNKPVGDNPEVHIHTK